MSYWVYRGACDRCPGDCSRCPPAHRCV